MNEKETSTGQYYFVLILEYCGRSHLPNDGVIKKVFLPLFAGGKWNFSELISVLRRFVCVCSNNYSRKLEK